MTPDQEKSIEGCWRKMRSTRDRVTRAGEQLKNGGLAQVPQDKIDRLDRLYRDAVDADSAAHNELEQALRNFGINI